MIRRSLSMNEIQSRSFRPSVNANLKVGFQSSRGASNSGHIPARLGFIGRLLILARQRISWSPALITAELWRLFVNLGAYREILRLLKLRPFDEIAQSNPRLALKFVVPDYLARGFTVRERASCVLHHYRRMHSALPESTLRQILHGYVTLHEFHKDGNRFALTMGLPEQVGDREGELSLDLRVNSNRIFNLSFTIIPGWVVKSEVSEVLLITRLQGMLRSGSEIRLARRPS